MPTPESDSEDPSGTYYSPQISPTGFLMGQSRALSELFTGPARLWALTSAVVASIFTAGEVRAGVHQSEAQKREMVIPFQKTIYNAFREVSDALLDYDRTREQLKQEELLVRALSATVELSTLPYKGNFGDRLLNLETDSFEVE